MKVKVIDLVTLLHCSAQWHKAEANDAGTGMCYQEV
jgi:hypothetical protein